MRELCVITGGAGGVGMATAKIVGQDRLVLVSDVSPSRLEVASAELQRLGIDCVAVECDVTNRASVAELIATSTSLGSVTSVIHTAGVSPSMGDAERILRINALGTVHVNEAFLPLAREGFAIVNVASMAAHVFPRLFIPKRRFREALRNEDRFMAKVTSACNIVPTGVRPGLAYSISKNFVTWYCASQAARFGSRGARIVSVSPGSIDTEMGRLEEQAGSGAMVKLAALKRFGKPEEVAAVLAFCASTKAGYLTGVDIACDGGVLAAFTLKNMLPLAARNT
ncbi:oxidoreductase [Mycobacterium scrofulaceum]|uniref:SDR family oxidoreductase n=1 Tax=Mycobacterium scrofulaceum TaxID=1783 RepID=UPI0007FFCB7A|nr:SDR family oxidoreductase [Mycobacterium scrofulaceum]OBH78749.1 oxidoreductase [Mycobacterium scrofulaceum]